MLYVLPLCCASLSQFSLLLSLLLLVFSYSASLFCGEKNEFEFLIVSLVLYSCNAHFSILFVSAICFCIFIASFSKTLYFWSRRIWYKKKTMRNKKEKYIQWQQFKIMQTFTAATFELGAIYVLIKEKEKPKWKKMLEH